MHDDDDDGRRLRGQHRRVRTRHIEPAVDARSRYGLERRVRVGMTVVRLTLDRDRGEGLFVVNGEQVSAGIGTLSLARSRPMTIHRRPFTGRFAVVLAMMLIDRSVLGGQVSMHEPVCQRCGRGREASEQSDDECEQAEASGRAHTAMYTICAGS